MIKKVFRPFWSYDVIKTEEWLSSMAKEGYIFQEFNGITRQFIFKKEEPKQLTFEIGYDKLQGESLPKALVNDGWKRILRRKKWFVLVNEKPRDEIKTSSVREGVIKRNRTIFYIYSGILIYALTMALINISMLLPLYLSGGEVTRVESPLWIITYTFGVLGIALLLIAAYSVVKIKATNNQLIKETNYSLPRENTNREENRLLEKDQVLKKRKLNWMYSPDKLENWLEEMEEKGYHLYKVKKGIIFYFHKSDSRKVSYCVEYQTFHDELTHQLYKDAGWKQIFATKHMFQRWSLWSQEYEEGDVKPVLYSDGETRIKLAKRITLTHTFIYLPLLIMYFYIIMMLTDMFTFTSVNFTWLVGVNVILFTIVLFQFGSNLVKTWLYYIRLRNSINY